MFAAACRSAAAARRIEQSSAHHSSRSRCSLPAVFVAGVFLSATSLRHATRRALARKRSRAAGATTVVARSSPGLPPPRARFTSVHHRRWCSVFPLSVCDSDRRRALTALDAASRSIFPSPLLVGFQGFRVLVEARAAPCVYGRSHAGSDELLRPQFRHRQRRDRDRCRALAGARAARSPRLVFAWNTLGVALLLNILIVALLSADPTPMRVFMNEPANVWVTRAPWIWLPTVMVLAAMMGHVLVYRRLWIQRTAASGSGDIRRCLPDSTTGAPPPHT